MPNGIILLDKPQGLTSNGALQRVRKAYRRERRARRHPRSHGHRHAAAVPRRGHQGHRRNRIRRKCYEFTVQLGARTDTGDAEGEVVESSRFRRSIRSRSSRARRLPGVQQVPPMYSALKRDGRPLYELARQGSKWSAPRARSRSAARAAWPRPTPATRL
jgi:tRNA pseudouridine55 synthase